MRHVLVFFLVWGREGARAANEGARNCALGCNRRVSSEELSLSVDENEGIKCLVNDS